MEWVASRKRHSFLKRCDRVVIATFVHVQEAQGGVGRRVIRLQLDGLCQLFPCQIMLAVDVVPISQGLVFSYRERIELEGAAKLLDGFCHPPEVAQVSYVPPMRRCRVRA